MLSRLFRDKDAPESTHSAFPRRACRIERCLVTISVRWTGDRSGHHGVEREVACFSAPHSRDGVNPAR